jgi:hypothetical protein
MKRLLAVAMLLALAGSGIGWAHDDDDEQGDFERGEYEESLDPHGDWVDDATYGHVWRPRVTVGWAPYVNGYWGWGSHGWTWISYDPFGWTFHYGRWALAPAYGWVWCPGSVWGPAWVTWYWGNGYVGWAPLSPFGYAVPTHQYVYVRDRHFNHGHIHHVRVRHDHVPNRVLVHRGGFGGRPPDVHHVTRVAGRPVHRIDREPDANIAPWKRSGGYHRGRRAPEQRAARPVPHLPERTIRTPAQPGSGRPKGFRQGGSRHEARPAERHPPPAWRARPSPGPLAVHRGEGGQARAQVRNPQPHGERGAHRSWHRAQ